MEIKENYNLKNYNTFGLNVSAKKFYILKEEEDFQQASKQISTNKDYFILGGGSNLLFNGDYNGTLYYIDNKGIEILEENEDSVLLSFSAGENWHNSVEYCINNGFYGLENLALIPGKIGSAPVQNIGAYGIEQCDFIEYVVAFHKGELIKLSKTEMNFSYRNSIFKQKEYKDLLIYKVIYKLHKNKCKINRNYKDIIEYFEKNNVSNPKPFDVFNAVINIRSSKLPDPQILGNAGSFFKNPICSFEKALELKGILPDLPIYKFNEKESKLSAAFLIDKAGFKGYRMKDVGTYSKHALIICNFGNASGTEIFDFSENIIISIKNKFGITLEREVIVL